MKSLNQVYLDEMCLHINPMMKKLYSDVMHDMLVYGSAVVQIIHGNEFNTIKSEHYVHNFPLVADPNLKENEYFITPDGKHTFTVPKSGTYKLNGTFTLPKGMTIDTSKLLPGDYISSIPYDPNGAITATTPQKMTRAETWDDLYNPKTEIKGTFKEDCKHEYLVYNGYNDSFEYCKHCDEKKKLT